MTTDDRIAAVHLLETGTFVPFKIVEQQVVSGSDAGEFGVRIGLLMDGGDEAEAADVVTWGALGFMFVLATLSFGDARPRGASAPDFKERDDLRVCDFLERVRFEEGELHFYGDYIRGRRMKTGITVRSDGSVRLETFGRGKLAARWLARLQGEKPLEAVQRRNEGISSS